MSTRRSNRFRPQILNLETRAVPASLYVDPLLAGSATGATVTFNASQSDAKTGLVFGTNAFATLPSAITKANSTSAADQIFLSTATISIDQGANAGAFLITAPLDFVGSSAGTGSVILSKSDTDQPSGTNGALFAAQNTTFNLTNLTLDGNGTAATPILTATGFRYENSTGTVSGVTVRNVIDDTTFRGYGIVAIGTSANITVQTSKFTNNGRGGVRFDSGATGTVKSSTFTGRSGNVLNYGVDVQEGSKNVLITGNTFTGFTGTVTPAASAGVQVSDDGTFDYTLNASNAATNFNQPSNATIIGNSFTGNDTAIVVGVSGTKDASTALISNNNIVSNNFGIISDTTQNVTATNNFWGSTAGPLATNNTTSAGNNPGGVAGSEVGSKVVYKDATLPNAGILQAATPVAVASTPAQYVAAVAPTVTVTGPTGTTSTTPVTLTVTFSSAVTGFTASDVVLSGTSGTGTVQAVTNPSNDKKTFVVTASGFNKRGTVNINVPAGAATDSIGYASQAATAAAVSFAPVFDRGFVVGGDAGIVQPVFTINDSLATNSGTTPFTGTGGVRVATADVNGDGTLDIIVGSGPGTPGTVKVYNGTDKTTVLLTFVPFGNSFTKGIFVAAGDLTGDGKAEIVLTAEKGGGARVRVLAGAQAAIGTATTIADFYGLEDVNFHGGARAAIGDVNGDGANDLIVAAGFGGGPRIATFNGKTLNISSSGGTRLCGDFFAFESTLRNGAFVAAGDVNGDGKADIVVGAGNGDPRVRAINGATIISSNGTTVTALADFYAFPKGTAGTGARVAARDIDGDGKADILASTGANNGSQARLYFGSKIIGVSAPPIGKSFDLFGSFANGAYVG